MYFYGINIGSVHVDFYYDISFYSGCLGIPLFSSLIVDTLHNFHVSLLFNYIIVLDMFGQPHLEDVHAGTLVSQSTSMQLPNQCRISNRNKQIEQNINKHVLCIVKLQQTQRSCKACSKIRLHLLKVVYTL